jgi:CDP-diacylglycerol---glycerol-3-phosphate 3-phosphatidyltransferase
MTNQSFVSPKLRARLRGFAVPLALALGRLGLTPNSLTLIGFAGTCLAAMAAALQLWLAAGVLVLVFGIFDLFDGALARATGKTSKLGAFLDSTLDRTGENLVLAGVAYGSAAAGFPLGSGLAALALALASVVTYARAKAEVIGLHGEVGIAPRPERLVVLAIGLVAAGIVGVGRPFFPLPGRSWLALALAIIAVTSGITVIQRIVHVRRQLNEGAK